MDTIIGKAQKGVVGTVTDRLSGYIWTVGCPDKQAWPLSEKIKKVLRPVRDMIHTITTDNGLEFAEHQRISNSLQIDYYFADPRSEEHTSELQSRGHLVCR